MSVRTYNPSVRVGNWSEDICLEEDTLKDHLEKKDRGQLLIQKASNLQGTILKPTELAVSVDGFVHFGDCVMLMNEEAENQVVTQFGVEPRQANVLSVSMPESKMHEALKFGGKCDVSSSKHLEPNARNTFVICPTLSENIPLGAALTYGQHFCLRTLTGIGGNVCSLGFAVQARRHTQLMLQSDIATFQQSAKKSRKQLLSFVEETPSYLTHWRILSFDPQIRMETEGLPVPANQKIIFNHCKTNQSLCVISDFAVRTPFGREYEVVAHTDLNSHKAENDVNHWIIKTGHPSAPSHQAATLAVGEQQ